MGETTSVGSRFSFLSPRFGTLAIGFIDVVLGLVGLSFLSLDAVDRHNLLIPFSPLDSELRPNLHTLDEVGESYQFLLEFWLPSLFLSILGATLIFAAVTRSRCLALFSFVLSTLFVAGCLATIISLVISQKVGPLGFLPLSAITLCQIYFYVVVGTFWMEAEGRRHPEDKEMLIIEH